MYKYIYQMRLMGTDKVILLIKGENYV